MTVSYQPYSTAWSVRQFVFLVHPAVVYFLPPAHTIPIIKHLPFMRPTQEKLLHKQLVDILARISQRLALFHYGSASVHHDPKLSALADSHSAVQRIVAERVWSSPAARQYTQRDGINPQKPASAAKTKKCATARSQVRGLTAAALQPPL
jgi:hypothetical protein